MTDQNPTSDEKNQGDQSQQGRKSDMEQKLLQELAEMTETCKRAMADLENYKKNMQQQLNLERTQMTVQIIGNFLPLLDSFERSRKFIEQLPEEHRKGIEAIYQQLKQIFEKYGVQEIKTAGENFNGTLHEAMMQGPGEANKILDEFEKGYIINSVVVRPAKVKIGDGTT